jgi:hypothetical protein
VNKYLFYSVSDMWSLFLNLPAGSRNSNGLYMREIFLENSALVKAHYWDVEEYFNIILALMFSPLSSI